MFLVTNFYFRHYEFLCSSLSFFENAASFVVHMKCHFNVVKIVSESLPLFILKSSLKNSFSTFVCTRKKCPTAICRGVFRSSLNRPLPEITFLQYALASILRPLFAGVVYGASLTCCVIVSNGVILK